MPTMAPAVFLSLLPALIKDVAPQLLSYENIDPPVAKDETKYLPMMYGNLRYSRLARNLMENRSEVAMQLRHHPAWDTSGLGTYRTFRPRFLNYLVRTQQNGATIYKSERRPVSPVGLPFFFASFPSHFMFSASPDVGPWLQSQDVQRASR